MRTRVANESEHRRGLVLGLTLAEALILLLFLILLALGARIVKIERSLADVAPIVDELRKQPEFKTIDARKLITELSRIKALEAKLRDLEESISSLKGSNAQLAKKLSEATSKLTKLEKTTRAASIVDPNDPPALMKLAPETFDLVEIKIDKNRWSQISELVDKIHKRQVSLTDLERERFQQALAKVLEAGEGNSEPHEWPPIIKLSDADDYKFTTGSAELTDVFIRRLTDDIVPRLMDIAKRYKVDVIEVVGHTDEQAIASRPSNLDKELLSVLRREKDIKTLIPADNAGLGLARALAVTDILKADQRLLGLRVLPLSGAQLIQINETLTTGDLQSNVRERRRIEIRLRKRA